MFKPTDADETTYTGILPSLSLFFLTTIMVKEEKAGRLFYFYFISLFTLEAPKSRLQHLCLQNFKKIFRPSYTISRIQILDEVVWFPGSYELPHLDLCKPNCFRFWRLMGENQNHKHNIYILEKRMYTFPPMFPIFEFRTREWYGFQEVQSHLNMPYQQQMTTMVSLYILDSIY